VLRAGYLFRPYGRQSGSNPLERIVAIGVGPEQRSLRFNADAVVRSSANAVLAAELTVRLSAPKRDREGIGIYRQIWHWRIGHAYLTPSVVVSGPAVFAT